MEKRPERHRPGRRPLAEPAAAARLTPRTADILREAVDAYLATGEPVGSHALADGATVGLSSATIRVALGELSDLGLLCQPHTSAGRVPTEAGLRLYVDALLRPRGPSPRTRVEIDAALRVAGPSPRDIVEAASHALATRCDLTAVARRPRLDGLRLRALSILRLGADRLLTIVVFDDGTVRQRTLEARHGDAELSRAQNLFADELLGRTLAEARALLSPEAADAALGVDRETLSLAAAALPAGDTPDEAVVVSGRLRVVDRMEREPGVEPLEVLRALEDKALLLQLLDDVVLGGGQHVLLGDEAAAIGFGACAVVAAPYFVGAAPAGTVAVVGPARLAYARVIPLVNYTAGAISGILRAAEVAA